MLLGCDLVEDFFFYEINLWSNNLMNPQISEMHKTKGVIPGFFEFAKFQASYFKIYIFHKNRYIY